MAHPRWSSTSWKIPPPIDRGGFELAILCALPLEADAVIASFDTVWGKEGIEYGKAPGDLNAYTTGVIGKSNVVLAHLSRMGKVSATEVAANLNVSFQNIKLAIVVGICGGIPVTKSGQEIFLGDVVISKSIVQYDYGKQYPHEFHTLDQSIGQTSIELQTLIAKLQTGVHHDQLQERTRNSLLEIQQKLKTAEYPSESSDTLFDPTYHHMHRDASVCHICDPQTVNICPQATTSSCQDLCCETNHIIRTRPRQNQDTHSLPAILFGKIASGDRVIKSGTHRDLLAKQHDVIAFEMESAGVWSYFPSLVIKGVSDYADSHKNKAYQPYAAATAAACTKAFLTLWKNDAQSPFERLEGSLAPKVLQSLSLAIPATLNGVRAFDIKSPWAFIQGETTEDVNAQPRYIDTSFIAKAKVSQFVGRGAVFEEIDSLFSRIHLSSNESPVSVGLVGMGGIGKTQIAIQYCRHSFDRIENKFHTVLWINASSEDAVITDMAKISNVLAPKDVQFENVEERAEFVKQRLNSWKRPYLIVYDNFDDLSFENIHDYLPSQGPGALLFTSRMQDIDQLVDFTIQTPLMEPRESLDLLLLKTKRQITNPDEEQALTKVISALGYLPLAIDQAAAYITHGAAGISFEEFMRHYEEQREVILKTVPRFWKYRDITQSREKETSLSVLTTWNLSLQKLGNGETDHQDKTHFLTLMAFLSPLRISMTLFKIHHAAVENSARTTDISRGISEYSTSDNAWMQIFGFKGFDDFKMRSIVSELSNLSLIRETSAGDLQSLTISLHPLVKDWAMFRVGREQQSEYAYEAMAVMCNVLNSITTESFNFDVTRLVSPHLHNSSAFGTSVREMITELQSHLDAVINNTIKSQEIMSEYLQYYYKIGDFLVASQAFDKATKLYSALTSQAEISDEGTIRMCTLYVRTGRTDEVKNAIIQFTNEWRIENDDRSQHTLLLTCLCFQASLNVADYAEAAIHAGTALRLIEQRNDDFALVFAIRMLPLFIRLPLMGPAKSVLKFVEERMKPNHYLFDELNLFVLDAKLAVMIREDHDGKSFDVIEKDFTEALENSQRNSRYDQTLSSRLVLAIMCSRRNEWLKAIELSNPVFDYIVETFALSIETCIDSATAIAEYHLKAFPDQPQIAQQLFERLLDRAIATVGPFSFKTKLLSTKFGLLFSRHDHLEIAFQIYHSIFINQELSAEEQRIFYDALSDYGFKLRKVSEKTTDQWKEFQTIISLTKEVFLQKHFSNLTDRALINLIYYANNFQNVRKFSEALSIFEFLDDFRDEIFSSHPENGNQILNGILICGSNTGKYEDALRAGELLIERYETMKPPQAETVIYLQSRIAEIYTLMSPKRSTEAIALYTKIAEWRNQELGPDHDRTINSVRSLTELQFETGQFYDACLNFKRLLQWTRKKYTDGDFRQFNAIANVTTALAKVGDIGEAESYLSDYLMLMDKCSAESSSEFGKIIGLLGHLQNILGKYEDAEVSYQRCIACSDGANKDRTTIDVMLRLTEVWAKFGKWQEMRNMTNEILDWLILKDGENDAISIDTLSTLGYEEFELGNYEQARSRLERSLELEEMHGSASSITQISLARCYFQLNLDDKADDILSKLTSNENEIVRRRSGVILGRVKYKKGDLRQAEELFQSNLDTFLAMDPKTTKSFYPSWQRDIAAAKEEYAAVRSNDQRALDVRNKVN